MNKRYYIVNGMQPWTKADEKRLDALMPKSFMGNVTEKLIEKGYQLDEKTMTFYTPKGVKVCSFCEAI